MQHTVELDHRRRAPLDRGLGVTMGTVDIGQQLPPSHTQPEILERHRRRMIQQRLGGLPHQQFAAARVGMRPPQLLHLRNTDLTGMQPGTDRPIGRHQPRCLQPALTLLIRPPNRRFQPPPHRHMTIDRVHRAALQLGDHHRQLRLLTTNRTLQPTEPLDQRIIRQCRHLADQHIEHASILTKGCHTPRSVTPDSRGRRNPGARG